MESWCWQARALGAEMRQLRPRKRSRPAQGSPKVSDRLEPEPAYSSGLTPTHFAKSLVVQNVVSLENTDKERGWDSGQGQGGVDLAL